MKKFKPQSSVRINNSKDLIQVLLKNRGIKGKKEIDDFLNPKLNELSIKNSGIDSKSLEKSYQRIKKAIENKEQIVVYGDYDVDGITGTAILWETLNGLGAIVMPYIPHRIDEGYGLSEIGITNLLKEYKKTSLIITVDNGIVATDSVDFANKKNIDVIITDHHLPGKLLPKAYSIIHTTKVCGAAVGWFLGRFISQKLNFEENPKRHLELVALATVADLMPLTGLNRVFVKFGLDQLRLTKRLGLLEIYKEAQIQPNNIDAYQIGHIIAPRLNAMGRLSYAMDSLRLLCTSNKTRARELAFKLGTTNRERQKTTIDSFLHAKNFYEKLTNKKKLIFISDKRYQQGVIGLIAGRLVEEFYKPAIVLSIGEIYSKASARSVKDFNIIEFIRNGSEFLVDAGGHPGAAGFTVETKNLGFLQKKLEDLAEAILTDTHLTRKTRIDAQIPLDFINEKISESIRNLEPFGMGNPEPIFLTRDLIIESLRIVGSDGKHLKLQFRNQNSKVKIDGIYFGAGEDKNLKIGDKVDVVYSISENVWNGNKRIEIKLRDISPT